MELLKKRQREPGKFVTHAQKAMLEYYGFLVSNNHLCGFIRRHPENVFSRIQMGHDGHPPYAPRWLLEVLTPFDDGSECVIRCIVNDILHYIITVLPGGGKTGRLAASEKFRNQEYFKHADFADEGENECSNYSEDQASDQREKTEDSSVKTEHEVGRKFPLDARSMSALTSFLTGNESSTASRRE